MDTFNEDPKPGRLVLPLVLIGMIATTYTFINRVATNNDLDLVVEETPVETIAEEEVVEDTSTTSTTTTSTTTTTIPLAGLCSNENYPQYERLPSDVELLVVWMRVDENCNQNFQPVGGKASAYCFDCGHPFGGSGSSQGVWVWSHMYQASGNHAGIGSGGVFNPVSKICNEQW